MTIAGRNKAQLIAIAVMIFVSAFSLIFGVMFFFKGDIQSNFDFTASLGQNFFLTAYSVNAVLISIIACPIIAMVFLIFIYNMFKQTHAVEISFFVAFIFSLGFESLRLFFLINNFSDIVLENISLILRLIYFFRLSAIFSLFISSVFAIKLLSRQTTYVILSIFFVAFLLTVSMPVNNFQVNKFFLFGTENSYPYQFMLVLASLISCINYFIAYTLKHSKVYLKAAINISILILAYWLLIYSSSYLCLALGLSFFVIGSIFFVLSIHTYHLWE